MTNPNTFAAGLEAAEQVERDIKGFGWDDAPAVHPYDKGYIAACDKIAATIRAIPVPPPEATGMRLKPLVWDENGSADVYRVTFANGQGAKAFILSRGSKIIGWHDDPEEAKAAAEADYRARALAMWETAPPDAVAEAVRAEREACAMMAETWGEHDFGEPAPGKIFSGVCTFLTSDPRAALAAAIRNRGTDNA